MILEVFHPRVASRSCESCRKWQYDDSDKGTKQIIERGGRRMKRRGPTPCDTGQGCPKGHYDNTKELSPKNRAAYWHYQECRAVGQFPDDSIVRRNAAIIHQIELAKQRTEHGELKALLMISRF